MAEKRKEKTIVFAYRRMRQDSKSPERGTKNKIGWVCFAAENAILRAGERKQIALGFEVEEWPEGTYGRLTSRPCLSLHHGIEVGGGVLEPDFHDEVKVLLYNFGQGSFVVRKGKKICLLVFEKVLTSPTFGSSLNPVEKAIQKPSFRRERHEYLSSSEAEEEEEEEEEAEEEEEEEDGKPEVIESSEDDIDEIVSKVGRMGFVV
jgi:dUTP pyrophosphatase